MLYPIELWGPESLCFYYQHCCKKMSPQLSASGLSEDGSVLAFGEAEAMGAFLD